jgi:hypothetical protein
MNRQISLMIGIFIVGAIAGAVLTFTLEKKTSLQLPPSMESLLTNPAISGWSASMKGVLTAKDDQSVTLNVGGKEVRIPISDQTLFFDSKTFQKRISLAEIPLGTTLSANTVFDQGGDTFFGATFVVVNE